MQPIFLIQIAGRDQIGVLAGVSNLLAQYDTQILDVGESVIQSTLSLNLLVRPTESANMQQMAASMLTLLEPVGLHCEIEEVTASSYEQWVHRGGQKRYIITLLTEQLTAEQLESVATVCARNNLNIDRMARLSGRRPLNFNPSINHPHCVELSVRGEVADEVALRADWLQVTDKLALDISIQEDNLFRRHRRLVVFDMDSTLIEVEVIDELAKLGNRREKVIPLTERAMRGEIGFEESLTRRVKALAGIDGRIMAEVIRNMPLTRGADRLVRILKKLGYRVAIISGGFEYFASHLGRRLHADYVFANKLVIENNVITGELRGDIIDGQGKANLLQKICRLERISLEQVIAVGDGANDLEMLSRAGLGIAYRAKPKVAASSQHSISRGSLDTILFLLGISDRQLLEIEPSLSADVGGSLKA